MRILAVNCGPWAAAAWAGALAGDAPPDGAAPAPGDPAAAGDAPAAGAAGAAVGLAASVGLAAAGAVGAGAGELWQAARSAAEPPTPSSVRKWRREIDAGMVQP